MADVIDNSITAGATNVHVFADANSGFPRLAVVDDGAGMSATGLQQAMRLGSKNPSDERDSDDLGRFGLGLKTASFSQCRRLTVATRQHGEWHVARWDLDHVYETDEWQVQVPPRPEELPWADELGEHGTLILWEEVDRVVDSESLDEIAKEFNRRVASAANHLELVFHRFMEGDRGLRKVSMSLNRSALKPLNPFNPGNPATITDPEELIGVAGAQVRTRTYTLPHFSKVSPDEWERHAGERGYLREQGFYLYRAGRLIVHGTWFGLAKQTELTKLARVRIDIPNGMDELWKIDVLKASAHPPHVVQQRLRRIVERLGATSKRVHVNRGRRLTSDENYPVWERRAVHEGIRYGINANHPAIEDLRRHVGVEAESELERVLQLLGASLPIDSLVVDLGESPHLVKGNDVDDEALELLATSVAEQVLATGLAWADVEAVLRSNSVLGSSGARSEAVIGKLRVKHVTS